MVYGSSLKFSLTKLTETHIKIKEHVLFYKPHVNKSLPILSAMHVALGKKYSLITILMCSLKQKNLIL